MNPYPRSFLRLVLLAWVLMALPLFIAIAFASLGFSQLSERSATAMQQASAATRLSAELDENLVQMERLLGQYEILRDPTLLSDYAIARARWRANCEGLMQVPLLTSLSTGLKEMLTLETVTYAQFEKDEQFLKSLRTVLGEHGKRGSELNEHVRRLTEAERQSIHVETETFQQRLMVAVIAAVVLAGILFWIGRRVLAKLLKNVERAVIALGNNLLERRIQLDGPDDLRWIGARLDWLRKRMLALETERSRILRHVSHELKTPLAALREGSNLLSEGVAGPMTQQQEKIAGIMQSNTLRLQELIDGLLKLQQAEHARELIEPHAIRLDDLIQEALATYKLAARDKQLRITGTLAPLTVMGGREEMMTIVNNLLSNAIKFSPERGTVKITLTRDNKFAILDVVDEGPGVPEADRKNIFEPFYRGPETKSVAGYGLGLAIAREFALAQSGSLELLQATLGAHFRASLPLAGANA